MALIVVTRLRLRSPRHLLPSAWATGRALLQARRQPGFLRAAVLADRGRAFWTATAWTDEAAMRAFRDAGAHRQAMPRLPDWCDQAGVVRWTGEPGRVDWTRAHRRLLDAGRATPVRHPASGPIPPPRRLPTVRIGPARVRS